MDSYFPFKYHKNTKMNCFKITAVLPRMPNQRVFPGKAPEKSLFRLPNRCNLVHS